MSKSALGRGLGALLSGASPAGKDAPSTAAPKETTAPEAASELSGREQVQHVKLRQIEPSSLQPRKDFPAEALRELADSIQQKGILQPLIVRKRGASLELIAGERRWRAAQMLGLDDVPVIVREADDHTVLELMLIENLQREDLNAIEEAQGYEQLIARFGLRQEDVAVKVGKNRATVANALRLLKLAPQALDWVRTGQISVGHAKAILGLESASEQQLVAERVIKDGMSVRQTEELVGRWQSRVSGQAAGKQARGGSTIKPDAHLADLENRLQQRVGTKVQLRYRQGKGVVTIHFYSDDDLDRILELLSIKVD